MTRNGLIWGRQLGYGCELFTASMSLHTYNINLKEVGLGFSKIFNANANYCVENWYDNLLHITD